jgi:hypothetical protein
MVSALACVYFEYEPERRSAVKLLSKDEARRMAATLQSCRKLLMCAFEKWTSQTSGNVRL